MAHCRNCGMEIDDHARICLNCGTPRMQEQTPVRAAQAAARIYMTIHRRRDIHREH